jgi:hypothetical protein
MLTGFQFAYCSAALDVNSGGSGGSATIGFREGYVIGTAANVAGPSGTDVGYFSLTGLPANTNCSSFFGGFACYLISAGFNNLPLCFGGDGIGAEPNVAWSWKFDDLGTDGVLSKTFPFLSCVATCTGGPRTTPPPTPPPSAVTPDGTGMINMVDQYCPPGTILSSFTFGTSNASHFTSISMDIREAAISTIATTSVIAGNPNILTEVTSLGIGTGGAWSLNCSAATVGNKFSI